MYREIRYIIICDSFDFFINVQLWIFKMIDWTKEAMTHKIKN